MNSSDGAFSSAPVPPEQPPTGGAASSGGARDASYPPHVRGQLRYLPVELGGEVIGYLYAGVRGHGASYIRRLGVQDNASGFNGAMVWDERLGESYREGLPPQEALRRWIGAPEHPTAGAVPADAVFAEKRSYEDLREYVNPGHAEPPLPSYTGAEYFPDGTPIDRSKDWGPIGPFTLDNPRYREGTDAAVRYLPVYRDDLLLGYLWAAETDDGAGFVQRVKARAEGNRAKGWWSKRMEQSKSDGLSPLEMLRSWIGASQDPKAGGIPADAQERSAPSLHELNIRARD